MSDDRLDETLENMGGAPSPVDMADFQSRVWARLDGAARGHPGREALGSALAMRAAPAAVALLIGGVVGAGAIGHAEPDLLAVFDADAGWSFTALVDEGADG